MNYKRMLELAKEHREMMIKEYRDKMKKLASNNSESDNDYWSDEVSVTLIKEWNMHGEGHQNNVDFEFFREDGTSWGRLWYTQFAGPYYSSATRDFISGTIILKDLSETNLDSLTSQDVKQILLGRKFRIRISRGIRRLRNRFNLLELHEKISLINEMRGKDVEENAPFLTDGYRYDFKEV